MIFFPQIFWSEWAPINWSQFRTQNMKITKLSPISSTIFPCFGRCIIIIFLWIWTITPSFKKFFLRWTWTTISCAFFWSMKPEIYRVKLTPIFYYIFSKMWTWASISWSPFGARNLKIITPILLCFDSFILILCSHEYERKSIAHLFES